MRVTVRVRNLDGFKARALARTRSQREQIKSEVGRSSIRVFAEAQANTPIDSGFMKRNIRRLFTREGFNYVVGWHAKDFIGVLNPATQKIITVFYPVFVVYGTKRRVGRDPLTPALDKERPILRGKIAMILSGGVAS